MDRDHLVAVVPRLYHMAAAGSWPSVQAHGLLSTSALLDLYGVPTSQRRAMESDIRCESVVITHSQFGEAVIRDNKPLRRNNLEKRLPDDMTVAEWCEMLNRHVFFWPTEDQLLTLLNAAAYRNSEHDVVIIDTAKLIERHSDRIRLSPINSGNTIYPPKRQYGRETFYPIAEYPYALRRKERGARDAIVEVAVEHSVPDIADLTVRVERRQRERILSVVYPRESR